MAHVLKNTSELVKQMPPSSARILRDAFQQVRTAKKRTLHKATANTRKHFKQVRNGGREKR